MTAANNLLAAMIDAHIYQGNALEIDPYAITWRRVLDVNDRGLRNIVSGLGAKAGRAATADRIRHYRGVGSDGDSGSDNQPGGYAGALLAA